MLVINGQLRSKNYGRMPSVMKRRAIVAGIFDLGKFYLVDHVQICGSHLLVFLVRSFSLSTYNG